MREIAGAIQEGAVAFLRQQFKTIASSSCRCSSSCSSRPPRSSARTDHVALTFVQSGLARAIAFLLRRHLLRAHRLHRHEPLGPRQRPHGGRRPRGSALAGALQVAFRTGGITGMFCVGLGLIGATTIVFIFQNSATAVLVGFGFGASLIALFMRVGGGIFTKAADVGADLVGKVEAGIPEDDPVTPPRSPTTSATTSATAPAWRPTCSSPTRSRSSPRSSSATPPSSRST